MPSLRELILGKGMDALQQGVKQGGDVITALRAQQQKAQLADAAQMAGIQRTKDLYAEQGALYPGRKIQVSVGEHGGTIMDQDQLPRAPGSQLTPAVKKNEDKWGEKINHWETGGKPQSEEAVKRLEDNFVQLGGKIDIDPATGQKVYTEGGKEERGWWDHNVGGALRNWPTLQGLLAPAEKARASNLGLIAAQGVRAIDPQPASQLIESAQAGVYDPTAPNAVNRNKILDTLKKQQAQAAQVSEGARRMHATGYASREATQAEGIPYDDQGGEPNEDLNLYPEYDGSEPLPQNATPAQKAARTAFLRNKKAGR